VIVGQDVAVTADDLPRPDVPRAAIVTTDGSVSFATIVARQAVELEADGVDSVAATLSPARPPRSSAPLSPCTATNVGGNYLLW
jgi:hypothetical protein